MNNPGFIKHVGRLMSVFLPCLLCLAQVVLGSTQMVVRVGYYENPPKLYGGLQDKENPRGIFSESIDDISRTEGWKSRVSGLETYKRMIEIVPGQKAAIISGFSENEEVKKSQHLGVSQYIKKPFTYNRLGLAVKAALMNS